MCILALLCAASAAYAEWDGYNTGRVITNSTNVYEEPRPDAKIIARISSGEEYSIVEGRGSWHCILLEGNYDDATGWVPDTALDYVLSMPGSDTVPTRIEVICEELTVRGGPVVTAEVITTMKNGEHAYVVMEENGWPRVTGMRVTASGYEPFEGYINSDYVVQNPSHITLKQATQAFAYAAADAPRVGLVDGYTRLTVIGEQGGYWAVNLRAASAFISKDTPVWTDAEIISR